MAEQDTLKAREIGKGDEYMNDYINESIDVSRYSYLGEAYDKEWTLKDESFRDGVSVGISQGISQGIEQKSIEIAKNMLNENMDNSLISRITGLSINEINGLK